jgi:hypothetical protein
LQGPLHLNTAHLETCEGTLRLRLGVGFRVCTFRCAGCTSAPMKATV